MAKSARGARGRGRRKAVAKSAGRRAPPAARRADPWAQLALIVLGAVLALRLGVNALEPFPVHFDEAQSWAFGQAPALGYFSEPPLAAWLAWAVTGALGDTLFALRLPSAVAHALIGWLLFLTGRRLWDGRTGFWAAAGYTAAPGGALSAMIMSAEPLVMLFWAGALYALVRAAGSDRRLWWGVLGVMIGIGTLADYTMLVFALGALGHGLFSSRGFSSRGRDWAGAGIALMVAVVAFAPNLYWNLVHGLVTFRQVAGETGAGRGGPELLKLLEFLAVQLALIGPVFFAAMLIALRNRAVWRDDPGMRLVAWQTVPLIALMAVLVLAAGPHGNGAAPAYVGGALMAARWLVLAGGLPALRAQLGVGVAASLTLWTAAGLYAGQADALTRRLDPFRVTRLSEPFCELALGAMAEEGAEVLLADDRRRLSECMFYGGLDWEQVAIWNADGRADSQQELLASLRPGDGRRMLLAVTGKGAVIAGHFEEAREIESGRLATHIDRWVPFSLWIVRGFRGYQR